MKIILKKCLLVFPFFFLLGLQHALCQKQLNDKEPKLLIPFGHQMGIKKTIFSHSNNFLITSDKAITIISDVRSGKPLYYLAGSNPALSMDDQFIATVKDSFVMVWSVTGAELLNVLKVGGGMEAVQAEFSPAKNLMLVQTKISEKNSNPGEPKPDPDGPLANVAVWDYKTANKLYEFSSEKTNGDGSGDCKECNGSSCPIYGAWFNNSGDSIRLIYNNAINSYAIGNYNKPTKVCLIRPGKNNGYVSEKVKILDKGVLENCDAETAYCFTEQGNFIGSWRRPFKIEMGGISETEFEAVSPVYNYQATYSSQKIVLRNLITNTVNCYEVDGVRKLTFNKTGTHLLVQYINESPRIFTTSGFTETDSLAESVFDGFPKYVYETKTLAEGNEMVAILDSSFEKSMAGLPKMPKVPRFLEKLVPMPDINQMIDPMLDEFNKDIKNAFTNNGEIVNLYNRRPISKIQSLIKLSGEIKLSPDKTMMMLNTGKIISVYSIPYAKLLFSLKGNYRNNMFSPNSKFLVQYFFDIGRLNIVNLANGHVLTQKLNFYSKAFPALNFSADSKSITVSNDQGEYKMVKLETAAIIKEGITAGGYYASDKEGKYAIANSSEGTVAIYNQKDSAELFSIDLSVKSTGKKKDNHKAQTYNYRVCFASNAHSLLIWNEFRMVYMNDISHPTDTVMMQYEQENSNIFIYNATLSANGNYINVQLNAGPCIVFDIRSKKPTVKAGFELLNTNSYLTLSNGGIGEVFRSMSGGNDLGAKNIAEFSSGGDSVIVCYNDSLAIYSCADGRILKGFTSTGTIKYFSLENNLLISDYHGQLLFNKLNENQTWFSMIPFNNGETVFLLPDGTYFGSKSVTRHLGYIFDGKSLSYKQFDFNSNRPDLVLRALGNTDKKCLAIYDSALSFRRQREKIRDLTLVNFASAPVVTISNDKEIMGEVKKKDLLLKLNIQGGNKYPDRLAVFINGNPAFGAKGRPLSHKTHMMDTTIHLNLTEGSNVVEVSVFDNEGSESYRQPLYIQYSPDVSMEKNIYFMGIGAAKYSSGNNLTYATKDVTDVLDVLTKRYPGHVFADTLFNNQVTVENVKKLKTKLLKSQPDDIAIVYYSGHGEIDMNKAEAYFGTYDMDFNSPSKKGISIKDFNDLMEGIPSRNKAIFLDACHSGEINKNAWSQKPEKSNAPVVSKAATSDDELDKLAAENPDKVRSTSQVALAAESLSPGETDPFDLVLELFTDLYQGNGSNIIVAARGLEAAKECEEIGHGVFTYSVLKGVSQLTADADSNAMLTIGEIQNYVIGNVPVFSNFCKTEMVQRAAARKENEYNDWALIDNGSLTAKKKSMVKEIPYDPKQSPMNSEAKEHESKDADVDKPDMIPNIPGIPGLPHIPGKVKDLLKKGKKGFPN